MKKRLTVTKKKQVKEEKNIFEQLNCAIIGEYAVQDYHMEV